MRALSRRSSPRTLARAIGGVLGEPSDSPQLRQARIEAARIARAAVAGEITADEARAHWPLEEDLDPSVDALAHIYFDHYV